MKMYTPVACSLDFLVEIYAHQLVEESLKVAELIGNTQAFWDRYHRFYIASQTLAVKLEQHKNYDFLQQHVSWQESKSQKKSNNKYNVYSASYLLTRPSLTDIRYNYYN